MKKKITFIITAIIIAFVLYATLVTTIYKKEMLINTPVSRVQKEIGSIKSIAKWYMPFAITDTTTLKITGNNKLQSNTDSLLVVSLTGLSATYQVSEKDQSKEVAFNIMADTGNHSKITLSYRSNLWNKLTGSNQIIANAEKSLEHLKDYFGDTKKMYGYEMEVVELTDTTFLFTSKVVLNSSKKTALQSIYASLIKYASEKNMGYNGTKIFYASPFGDDSTHLFMSIGITNTAKELFSGDFTLKKMPYKGHLLSAYYQGSFGNVNKVINAMERFKSDNEMTTMAIPFVKLITDNVDFDENQIIQARAYYPVF
ncbi:hypothetical protein BH11BAC3_BH11BAC3_00340 [soil metagenome]